MASTEIRPILSSGRTAKPDIPVCDEETPTSRVPRPPCRRRAHVVGRLAFFSARTITRPLWRSPGLALSHPLGRRNNGVRPGRRHSGSLSLAFFDVRRYRRSDVVTLAVGPASASMHAAVRRVSRDEDVRPVTSARIFRLNDPTTGRRTAWARTASAAYTWRFVRAPIVASLYTP